MNIQSFLPKDFNRTRKAEVSGLVKKWEKLGLLEGLSDDRQEKSNVAILLENQAKQLVVEANRTGTDANSEEWAGVALPLVRRVFTEIAAKDFVSVQPMNLPTGLVFFLDFKYGTNQGGFQTGSGRTSQEDSVFGVTDARRGTPGTGGFYGAGRFSYTSNDLDSATLTGATAGVPTATTFASSSISTTAAWDAALNYDTVVSASLATAGTNIAKVTIATGSLTTPDMEAVRAFAISGSGILSYYPAFTKVNTSNHIEFIVSVTTDSTDVTNAVVTYTKQPTFTTRGDFEAGQASATFDTTLDIPEINLELRSEEITAKTRKLKTKWSDEFAQDLNAYHSLDAEAELTAMLSEYISHEIDLEILDMLVKNAQTVDYWSARNNEVWDGSKFIQQSAGAGGYYNSQGEWFQTLGTKLQKVSNEIHRLVLKGGGANFMVCSPTVSTVLESIPGYAANTDGTKMEYAMGVQKIGTINNRYTVYKNPYMTENTILLGYRGGQFLETGAVYAPYIPIMMTPTVLDPENFTPRKGIQTRYAKKIVRPEFYGKIYVAGLQTV
jgi:hypothetical protein